MRIDRRTMMAGAGAAVALGELPSRAGAAASTWYVRAIVIDALGGLGDPDSGEGS